MRKFPRSRALCVAMSTPPRAPSTPIIARGPVPHATHDDREALVRREWREGDVQHNLAVAAMAGMAFEQARQVAVAATPAERPLL
jgi:hypothetical protein